MTTFAQLWGEYMPIDEEVEIPEISDEGGSSGLEAWDEIYKRDGRVFQTPHEMMPELLEHLEKAGAERILDIGCGSGRHTVFLSEKGYQAACLDSSSEAVRLCEKWLAEKNITADVRLGNFLENLPYEDGYFDAVIAVQSIHHAEIENIRKLVGEIKRVLRPGGLIFVTVPSAPDPRVSYNAIAPFTLVPQTGTEKGLVHYYFMPVTLLGTFSDFKVINLKLDATAHYCLTGLRKD